MANQKGTTVFLTHPRTIVFLIVLAVYVVASAAIAISDKLEARRNSTTVRPTLTPTDAPTTDGWTVTHAMRYMRESTPPPAWISVPLDVVAVPFHMTVDDMVKGARHMDEFGRKIREQAADREASAAWDVRVERANRKLRNEPTTCTVEYEEGTIVRWMDVTVASSGLRIGVECGTATHYHEDDADHNGAYIEVLVGGQPHVSLPKALRNCFEGRDLGRADYPLLTLERYNSRPTHTMGWAE